MPGAGRVRGPPQNFADLVNLLRNAKHALREVARPDKQTDPDHRDLQQRDESAIAVTDNGAGYRDGESDEDILLTGLPRRKMVTASDCIPGRWRLRK